MSTEDLLRHILQSEASTVVPAGDGLSVIRERVARRRRLRLLLVPAGALATAAAVVGVMVLTGSHPSQQLQQDPVVPATQAPTSGPTPDVTPSAVPPYTGPAIWPFTSSAQGELWRTNYATKLWAGDPAQVAQHFVSDFLKLPGITTAGTGSTITLRAQGHDLGIVRLVQISPDGPWTVTSVGGSDLTITSPTPMEAISSPTKVTGRVVGVDESVQLQLIGSGTGSDLAMTSAPAGSAVPWEASVSWSDHTWFTAGLVAITRSNKDGSLSRITAIAVKRGP